MSLPRITFTGFHSCIRSFKQAIALKELGYTVNWVCHSPPPQLHFGALDAVLIYTLGDGSNEKVTAATHFDHFKKTIQHIDKQTDIYHAYNEPDWYVQTIKQVSEKPVVWDLHDLVSDRDFIVRDDEELEIRNADAIITQGMGYLKLMKERRPDLAKKGLIDYCLSAVPRIFWPELNSPLVMHGAKKFGGLVYEGGLASGLGGGNEFRYRWWLPIMEQLVKVNIPVTAHVAGGGDYSLYQKAGVRVVPPHPYISMMQQLTLYDWGLCGNAVHHPAFDKAWPNKLFEYLSAGLPIIVHDSKEVAEFVKEEGIGVVVDNAKDIERVYSTAPKYKDAVMKARQKYCMENEIQKVINIYNKLLSK